MSVQPARHWSYLITGPLLAMLLIVFWIFDRQFLTPQATAVTRLLESPVLTFGLILAGAYISAFLSGDFDIRAPLTYEPLLFAFGGGLVMGCGAVLAAMSVHSVVLFNLAGIFNLTAFMATKGWIYAFCMIAGGFLGSRFFVYLTLKTADARKNFFIPRGLQEKKGQRIIFYAFAAIFLAMLAVKLSFARAALPQKHALAAAVLLLIAFGAITERGTVCMSSMLKEWFIARSSYVWKTVLFTIMCLAALYQLGLSAGWYQPAALETDVGNSRLLAIGSFLMGVGFIFADGCFIGSLWKAGQGNIVNWVGIYGMLLGIGVTRIVLPGVLPAQQVAAGWRIPGSLTAWLPAGIFLAVLWSLGMILFAVFRSRKYHY
ncbi:MAG TPA: YeeE/YedE thiosulfate transporter family protein [Candidatus Omnitrophota bacterium]|nr:YeeE/YedE thiosulfate transporter family protein [Candidatus Omnitrophota bacterium]HRZ14390.1 YeeE/YedE thiosulfate transporter family protein [Candidatus Omnitrophota bacterium]